MNSTTSTFLPSPIRARTPFAAICEYVEKNPVAAIVQALAAGFVIGLIIRWLEGPGKERNPGISISATNRAWRRRSFTSARCCSPSSGPPGRRRARNTANPRRRIQEAVAKLKKSDLAKIGKKKANWPPNGPTTKRPIFPRRARKTKEQILDWLEEEAAELAKTGKKTAKQVEDWVDDEVVPTACEGLEEAEEALVLTAWHRGGRPARRLAVKIATPARPMKAMVQAPGSGTGEKETPLKVESVPEVSISVKASGV